MLMSGRTIPTTGEPPTPRSFDSLLTTHSSVFCLGASPLVQLVKNLPAMWEIWVRSLDWEDTLERGKATHSSILAWRIPWMMLESTIRKQKINFRNKPGELKWSESHSVVSSSLGLYKLYSPWNSPGQNTGVGSLSPLQGIFPTQGSNPGILYCRLILYQLSHREAQ